MLSLGAMPAENTSTEAKLKAAYLYKFCLYVEWPETAFKAPSTPLTIGVTEDDNISTTLRQIVAGRTVNQRAILVRRINAGDTLDDIQVLYLGHADVIEAQELLAEKAAERPILTVAEQSLTTVSAIMRFVLDENRIRFDVELDRAEQSGLHLSAELLSVARLVNRKTVSPE